MYCPEVQSKRILLTELLWSFIFLLLKQETKITATVNEGLYEQVLFFCGSLDN